MQNRECCHNPLNYAISVSNNGISFQNITEYHEDVNKVCSSRQIRSNKLTTTKAYHYIRLVKTGATCDSRGTPTLNLAEFDLFGTLIGSHNECSKQRQFIPCFTFFVLSLLVSV